MIYDIVKYRLLKGLEAEAEKTARYIELIEITHMNDDSSYSAIFDMRIDRAVIRYYALQRRIEVLRGHFNAAT